MKWRETARKAMSALLPWQARAERRAAIEAAAVQKERSQAARARAKEIERDIRRIAAQNNWAIQIAQGLGIPDRDRNGGKK